MAEPKSVRLGFVTGVIAVEKLQVGALNPGSVPEVGRCIERLLLGSPAATYRRTALSPKP